MTKDKAVVAPRGPGADKPTGVAPEATAFRAKTGQKPPALAAP